MLRDFIVLWPCIPKPGTQYHTEGAPINVWGEAETKTKSRLRADRGGGGRVLPR